MEFFDEDKAVKFILDKLKENPQITTKYGSDDILEVIDIIWDYYEDNGMLDLDMAMDEAEGNDNADKAELTQHVIKMLSKDKDTNVRKEDVPAIVDAELEYESLCDEF